MRTLSAVLILLLGSGFLVGQGKLDEVRKAVREDPGEPDAEEKADRPTYNPCDDDETWELPIDLGPIFAIYLLGPYYFELDPDHTMELLPSYWEYSPYPYWRRTDGHLHPRIYDLGSGPEHTELIESLKPWMLRLSIENGNDFSGLNRLNGSLLVDTRPGIGLYTSWNYLHENLGSGRHDDAVLGSTNLIYRLGNETFVQRWGIGLRSLSDDCGSDFGVNFLFASDLFPVRPIVASAMLEGGTLGHAGLFHARLTLGCIYRRSEIYAGYDYLGIGNSDFGTSIHGPMVGLRWWF